jgi:hypothetical protein
VDVTLTEFLLARIDDDEAIAGDVAVERIRIGRIIEYPAEGEDRSFWADYDGAGPSVSVGPHRVLAECEAKRRIVEVARFADEGPAGWGYRSILRLLALPYADHPDYSPEWRP